MHHKSPPPKKYIFGLTPLTIILLFLVVPAEIHCLLLRHCPLLQFQSTPGDFSWFGVAPSGCTYCTPRPLEEQIKTERQQDSVNMAWNWAAARQVHRLSPTSDYASRRVPVDSVGSGRGSGQPAVHGVTSHRSLPIVLPSVAALWLYTTLNWVWYSGHSRQTFYNPLFRPSSTAVWTTATLYSLG